MSFRESVHLQLRVELAGGTTLLATLTSITTSVATLAVTTALTTATAEGAATLLLTEHATRGSVRALLLDVGSRNDLGGQVEPLAQVVETLGGEGVVVCSRETSSVSVLDNVVVAHHAPPWAHTSRSIKGSIGMSPTVLPRELGLDITTRSQGLHGLDDEEVLDGDFGVLGEVVVLLGHEDSLTEEGLSSTMFNQPHVSSKSSKSSKFSLRLESSRSPDRKCIVRSRSRGVFDVDGISPNFRLGCLLLLALG